MASNSDENKTLKKLRSFFYILDPENSSGENVNREEIKERLRLIVQCARRVDDYYHDSQPLAIEQGFSHTIFRFLHLLRGCLLSHQWRKALKLVNVLTYDFTRTDNTVWKVGLACLFHGQERNSRLVEQFASLVHTLKVVDSVEVLLDYLLFLLSQSNTKDAKFLIQELKLAKINKRNPEFARRKLAKTLFFAYQGLALFVEWKLAIFRASHEEDDTEMISLLLSQGSSRREAQSLAEEAIEHLTMVKDTPGVWDIFISRLTEIYVHYSNFDDARKILTSYRESNPGNPNAHRYLYEFERNYGDNETLMTQCLEDIIKLDPCNPLCVNLYRLKEKSDPAAVSLLFDFLDYPHCKGCEEVWQLMADRLTNIDSKILKITVKRCWRIRRDWWPSVILRNPQNSCDSIEKFDSKTLLRNKCRVQDALFCFEKSHKEKRRSTDISECESDSRLTKKKVKVR